MSIVEVEPDTTAADILRISSSQTTTAPPRRIVKAAPPKESSKDYLAVDLSSDKVESEESSKQGLRGSSLFADSPVEREIQFETAELLRKERFLTATERQQTKRQEKIKEKRLVGPTATTSDANETPKANPFSRFLSVFSISVHPEHKRPYQMSDSDSTEPLEKRLRPSESANDSARNDDLSDDTPTTPLNSLLLSVVTVAIIATLVVFGLRKR
jgi:hypothetical protein